MPRRPPPPPTVTDRLSVLLERHAREREEREERERDDRAREAESAARARAGVLRIERGWVPEPPGTIGDPAASGRGVLPAVPREIRADDRPGESSDEPSRGREWAEEAAEGDVSEGVAADDRAGDDVEAVVVAPRRVAPPASRGGRHRAPSGASGPRVLTLPVSLRGARLEVSGAALVGLLVVVLAAGVVFTVRVTAARAEARPRAVSSSASSDALSRASTPPAFATTRAAPEAAGPTSSATSAGGTGPVMIVVDVAGQVARPGVVTVAQGARVVDALALAGGARPGADLLRVNLARPLVDGEQLYVPAPGETPPAVLGAVGSGTGAQGASGSGAAGGSPKSGSGAAAAAAGPATPLDLNAADLTTLDGLPGVGPVLAQRILDWRAQHGRFSSIDELGEVSGIGDKVLENLRPLVRV